MFRVYLTCFGYFIQEEFYSIESAMEKGKSTGFSFAIQDKHYNIIYTSP